MTSNKEFHFDFDETADPVDELHRLRAAKTKHFKTMDAYMEYLHDTPTVQEMIARLDAKIVEEKKISSPKKSIARRKEAKHLSYA